MTNNYGYKIAAKKAKEKEARKTQNLKPKKKRKQKSPELFFYPEIDGHKFREIDWDNDEMIKCSNELFERYNQGHKFQLISLDTGYGKTALAIHYIAEHLKKYPNAKIVIVAPRAIKDGLGWHETINSYNKTHELQIKPWMIETPDRFASILHDPKSFGKVIKELNHESLVVLDEVHNYKSPTSKRAKKLQKIAHIRKLGLTATAISNNLVLDGCSYLIMDGKFRNKTDFFRQSGLEDRVGHWGTLLVYDENNELSPAMWPFTNQFKEMLAGVIFKPDVDPLNFIMPELEERLVEIKANKQLKSDLASLKKAYLDRAFDSAGDFTNAVVYRINTDEEKIRKLINIVKMKKVKQPLIFYHNTSVLEELEKEFKANKIPYQIVSGSHPLSEVDKSKDWPIFIQYQAGSEGIEFKESNTSIMYQNQYSFVKLKQAKGRNVRRGSDHKVTHYYFQTFGTPDEEIYDKVQNLFEINEEFLNELIENYDY